MKSSARIAVLAAAAVSLAGCSMSSLLGGGGKAPPHLYDLTYEGPVVAAPPIRSAAAGETITIQTPIIGRKLRTTRVPVQVTPVVVEYVKDMNLVDTPDRLFQHLLEETVRTMTGRVVLDPRQSALDPGLVVTGELQKFGYDAQLGQVIVEYDASLATPSGTHVQARRFTVAFPADGTAVTVGPALNQAANQIAREVATWISS